MSELTTLLPVAQLFWISLIISSLVAFPVYRWLLKVKSRQIVSEHVAEHLKKQGTPTMGGLIAVIGTLGAVGYALAMRLYQPDELIGGGALFAGFALIGFADDFIVPRLMPGTRGLGWKQKLILQIGIALAGLYLSRGTSNPWLMGFGVFTVLFFSNAYNFSDGMDGLAGSLLIIFSSGLAVLGFMAGKSDATLGFCGLLVGAILPFLFLNAPPAKVFMGDVGALPIGALLGFIVFSLALPGGRVEVSSQAVSLGIVPATRSLLSPLLVPLLIASFVMIVELVPVPIQVASVKLFKKRVFPMTPIHHAFEKAGWPETRVVFAFCLVQLVMVALAIGFYLGQGA